MKGRLFFDDASAAVFRAVAGRILPSETGDAHTANSAAALQLVDAALAGRDAGLQKNLRLFLNVVNLAPVFRYGRPFTRLDPERQDAVLRFFANNRRVKKFRQGFWGLKTFALMGYYGSEDCWEDLGYPGPRRDAPYYEGSLGAGRSRDKD